MKIRNLVTQFMEPDRSLPKATPVVGVGRFVANIVLGEAINPILPETEGYFGPFPIYSSSSALSGPNDCQNEMTAGSGKNTDSDIVLELCS